MESSDKLTGSRDGQGAADNDVGYSFGNPKARLSDHHLARLLLLRGHVLEARFGCPDATADDLEPVLWSERAQ